MKDMCIQDDDLSWYKIKTPLESYLLYQGRKFSKRFDANTYLHLMSAWSNFDLAKEHNVKKDEDIINSEVIKLKSTKSFSQKEGVNRPLF